jgi:hypothetical protein
MITKLFYNFQNNKKREARMQLCYTLKGAGKNTIYVLWI